MPYRADGVGYRNADTSEEAAPADPSGNRKIVYDCIAERPDHCDGVAHRTGLSKFTVRPRLTELKNAGLIEDTGKRELLDSRKRGRVYRIVPREAQMALF